MANKIIPWDKLEYDFFHPEEVKERALNSVEHQKILAIIEKEKAAHLLSLRKTEDPIK
jgi:hypothetical protein